MCYTGLIAYPKSWYDRLLHPTSGASYKNNSVAYPKSGTIDYLTQQVGIYKYTTRSPTPRAVRSTTSPNKRHNQQRKLGRLPQERYNQLLHPKSGTITPTTRSPTPRAVRPTTSPKERHSPTTRSPTPRAVRSTTSPKERHKHSNNLVADPKSSIIKHSTQRTSAINSTTQSSDYYTPRAEQSAKNNSAIYSKFSMVDHFTLEAGTSNKYNSGAYP